MDTVGKEFLRLVEIMNELREKCPWDKKQTIQTLRQMTIEETYELADAITGEDWQGIREELGDMMLHIVFYSKIGTEKNAFNLYDVLHGICEKLIARHPHVYGKVTVSGADEVKKNWENLKLKEGKKSILGGVPASLPATVKAMRLQEKAKQVGFEWDNKEDVWKKVEEEIAELHEAIGTGDKSKIENEFGDVVFSLVNYARFLNIDAENALELTNRKFIKRFNEMEQEAMKNGKELRNMSLEEMDEIWNSVKKKY